MSDAEYPELKVVEASAPCPVLARLPRLPVSVLVLVQAGAEGEGKPLAARLARLADELGVGHGVQVIEHSFTDWPSLDQEPPTGRFDALFLHAAPLPPDPEEPRDPRGDVIDVMARLLSNLEVRFQVVGPGGGEADRRAGLLLALLRRGAPPAVLLPADWSEERVGAFEASFFERILHDAPLVQAAATASGDNGALPTLYQPPGRRHGLDLGRLLEDHRRRIEQGASALRMLQRETEAFRPDPEDAAQEPWEEIAADVIEAQERLEAIKQAVEEINRDRDPAGWSRLADSISALEEWEASIQQDRERLAAFQEAAYGAASRG